MAVSHIIAKGIGPAPVPTPLTPYWLFTHGFGTPGGYLSGYLSGTISLVTSLEGEVTLAPDLEPAHA